MRVVYNSSRMIMRTEGSAGYVSCAQIHAATYVSTVCCTSSARLTYRLLDFLISADGVMVNNHVNIQQWHSLL